MESTAIDQEKVMYYDLGPQQNDRDNTRLQVIGINLTPRGFSGMP